MSLKKIAITTDTNSGMFPHEHDDIGLFVLPMPFIIDGADYLESVNLSRSDFYEKLVSNADIKTSQPSPSDVEDFWREILKEYDANATFFLVGFWIDKYPEETKAIASAGFDIGNHSENHLNMPRLSREKIVEEIQSVNKKVYDLTGKTPTYFRAPFGDYDNSLMTALEDLGMVGVQWSIDSLDWKGLSAKDIVARIVPKAKSGDIVLFHNNSDHVLDALPLVLEALENKGFKFVALSQMVLTDNYTVDSQGVQRKND